MRQLVDLDRVSLSYGQGAGETLAICETSLRIGEGEFVAVVGPSGCGKSSLLKLVSGLARASSGNVIVAGREVTAPIKIVGMAFQNPNLLPWRNTLSNVLLPVEIVQPHRARLRSNRPALSRPRHAPSRNGWPEGVREQVSLAALGRNCKQRASLCRALMHEPNLLLSRRAFRGSRRLHAGRALGRPPGPLDGTEFHGHPRHA